MRHSWIFPALLGSGLLAASSFGTAAERSLVFCSEGSPAGFDTAQYTTATDNDAAEPLYNRLVEFERGATNVLPALAKSWDISEDGLTYSFHLREGVKFHSTPYFKPSRDLNADDVLFTFNRMLDAEHPFRKAYPTEFPYFNGMSLNKNIARVEKTDPLTVVMTLNTVDAAFIQNLAMSSPRSFPPNTPSNCSRPAPRARSTRNPSAPGPSCSSVTRKTHRSATAPTRTTGTQAGSSSTG